MKLSAAGTAAGAAALVTNRSSATAGLLDASKPSPAPLEAVLFNRTAFGPSDSDVAAFHQAGSNSKKRFENYIEQQLNPESVSDLVCDAKLSLAGLMTLNKSVKELFTEHTLAANKIRDDEKMDLPPGNSPRKNEAKKELKKDENHLRLQPVREVETATWIRAIYSRRQLQEVLVDHWHGHFSVYGWDNQIASVFPQYDRDVIRAHALGNFRDFLGAVAKSPAMLYYLDGFINQSGNPNENYARELFELHTLGAENYLGTEDRNRVPGFAHGAPSGYVDGDVYEAARCFTGWRLDVGKDKESKNTGEFTYFEQWHDRFQKIILGHALKEYQPPMKDGHDVLDILAKHPGTARFVCRRLCRRLIGDNPSESIVQTAAKVFHDNVKSKDQIKQVVRTILLSDEFKSTWGEKVKRPFEATVSAIRSLGFEFVPNDGLEDFFNHYQRAGHRLFQWRTPDGYPDTREKWTGTNVFLERWRLFNQLTAGKLASVKPGFNGVGLQELRSPEKIASHWAAKILGPGRSMSKQSLSSATALLSQRGESHKDLADAEIRDRLPAAVALLLMAPENQLR